MLGAVRRPLALIPAASYVLVLLAEGVRLNRRLGGAAGRTAIAIGIMQWAYGIGEWAGLVRVIRGGGPRRGR